MAKDHRGKGIGKIIVEDSIRLSKELGFKILATVPDGFRLDGDRYSDMLIFYQYWG